MKNYLLILIIIISSTGFGQVLDIGIMRHYSSSTIQISYLTGNYQIFGDTSEVTTIWKDQSVKLLRSGDKVKIVKNGTSLGSYDTVYVNELQQNNSFRIQCTSPSGHKERKYKNNLLITSEGSNNLKIVNRVEMHNYLAGVVETEGGGGKHIEYYKVQAILSRTYALDHLKKHRKDGFQLCDKTHCQAYYNMMRFTPDIEEAVNQTKAIVMINSDLKLADGFFFANCGGQTSESDFVWNVPVSYCRSVKDTFCVKSKQANWKKTIKKSTWKNYLVSEFAFPVDDSIYGPQLYHFDQPSRKAFYVSPQLGIPLRDLRMKFKLKSTWFSTHPEGDNVVLTGHGFGHGVGLCQEGAMKMAKQGFNHEEILNFYFTGVKLMNYYQWLFLNQEVTSELKL